MLRSQSSQHATPPLLGQQSQEPSSKLWTRVFQAAASGSLASRAGSLMDHIGVAPGSDTREKGSGTVWVALSLSQSGLPLTGHESPSPKPAAGTSSHPCFPVPSAAIKQPFPNFSSGNLDPTSHISHPHRRMTPRCVPVDLRMSLRMLH